MRILLDTVAFLWAVESPNLLSSTAREAIEDRAFQLELSALSLSEIAIKSAKGRLDFSLADVLAGIAELEIRLLPYTGNHAYRFFGLPQHHKDPFDRQIIAQALVEDVPVVSSDRNFNLYKGLDVLW